MENFLKMLRITNTPTVPVGDEETANDVDEPPDDKLSEMTKGFKKENVHKNAVMPSMIRRESLLTRAIRGGSDASPVSPRMPDVPRGLSTTSSHSFASTAELTSDVESPIRSATPSPPPPPSRLQFAPTLKPVDPGNVVIAPLTKDEKPTVADTGEAAVEKTLGRKRCIMFACKDKAASPPVKVEVKTKLEEASKPTAEPRKCRISFACPMKPASDSSSVLPIKEAPRRESSPIQRPRVTPSQGQDGRRTKSEIPIIVPSGITSMITTKSSSAKTDKAFHEFAGSHDDNEEWVEKPNETSQSKLTIDDCLKKENAIRKLGEEAEEEAEDEEREQDELDEEIDDEDGEDDFAPSDEESRSDDGNESDDENGFAESDDESDAGSEYRFWAPSGTTTKATSTDNMTHFSARQGSRSRASSSSSAHSFDASAAHRRTANKIKASKAIKMRPGTPELPDSTDFVCGTLDEDRPLEAAYISCREQKRREKHVLIPQDIDPSFPTTDPEDNDDDDEEEVEDIADSSDHIWMKGQFEGFDEDVRGRRPSAFLVSPLHSPEPVITPPRPAPPAVQMRKALRSPPPKGRISRSSAPRRLFDHAPRRLRSPPPTGRLRSPRGSPTGHKPAPFGITINHLAQRPNADKTSSLPHTPNPFFRNWKRGHQPISRITSTANASDAEDPPSDLHVRGPVDIVIGLEKKRQKRKEKYWRQHCRKAAREQADKRPPPGRGAERMKELGLECAERTRGYGLGQQAQLVLSL